MGGRAERGIIIFTDLDGTLLDHYTYSFAAALPALREIRRRQIPLVLCTSKTRAETEPYRRRLRNTHPFVIENGGAVYLPAGYFSHRPRRALTRDGYQVIPLGIPHREVLEAMEQITRETGITPRGVSGMSVARIRRLTGLSRIQASRAKVREYTEPFVLGDAQPRALRRLESAVRARGMTLTRGGRFWHLAGGGDKGLAVQVLISLYRRAFRPVRSMGIGDSRNDFPMLRRVDYPYLVSRPNGRYQRGYRGEGFLKAGAVGPEGWNRAVLKFLQVREHPRTAEVTSYG